MICVPGWRLEPWQEHPRLRRLGYSVREDTDYAYLIYGSEEVVAVLTTEVATVKMLEMLVRNDVIERLSYAVVLNRWVGVIP